MQDARAILTAMKTITQQIREAVERCGLSRYRISIESGVAQSVLSRFARGETGITLDVLDRLAPVVGIRIVVDPPKAPVTKRPKRKPAPRRTGA